MPLAAGALRVMRAAAICAAALPALATAAGAGNAPAVKQAVESAHPLSNAVPSVVSGDAGREKAAQPHAPPARPPAPAAGARLSMRQRMERVVIPELDLRQIRVVDLSRILSDYAAKYDKGSGPVNIIVSPKLRNADAYVVTLRLRNVTLWEALRYIVDAAGLGLRQDANAVVIGPRR